MIGSWTSLVHKARRFQNAHWPRYVFIHINKTAGSSIERALHLRFEHKTALQRRAELGGFRWSRAFKFTFVRNPWDKVVSHYYYRIKTNQTSMADRHVTFCDWVKRAYWERDTKYFDQPQMFAPQVSWICDDNLTLLVDYVGRFETLSTDFQTVCQRIEVRAALPHLKKSSNHDYRREYDQEARDMIAARFADDIAMFNYSF